jgi:alanine racemase
MRATRAEVDLSAIQYNIKQIARKVGNARILGVMKANAYGHGIVPASKAVLEAGASYVGVALAEEGIELRKHTDAPILVFSPPFEALDLNQPLESCVRYDLEPTITSLEVARALNSVAKAAGKKARVQIKIDTGMGRIGFFPEFALEAIGAIAKLDSLSIVGIYSHFATSDESNKEFARRQLLAFRNIVSAVKDLGLKCIFHIANSGAVLDMPDSYFDMVRPGITTYGYYPSLETTESFDIRPAFALKSNVVQVRDFKTGMSVSYGRRYFTKGPARIAVIPIGYGDGFTRLLTGKAAVLIRERKYPVAGTITMDHLMVDVGNDSDIQPGDEVTLIGRSGDQEITAWDIAGQLGTIPYEVLCMINSRVPRLYHNNSLGD